jgi:hypothetical protein
LIIIIDDGKEGSGTYSSFRDMSASDREGEIMRRSRGPEPPAGGEAFPFRDG